MYNALIQSSQLPPIPDTVCMCARIQLLLLLLHPFSNQCSDIQTFSTYLYLTLLYWYVHTHPLVLQLVAVRLLWLISQVRTCEPVEGDQSISMMQMMNAGT